jgi:ribosomal protein S18 acetylase RimI-like enzyme
MEYTFAVATEADAGALAALRNAVADALTRKHGNGPWSPVTTESGVLPEFRLPMFSRIMVARRQGAIVGTLRLATKRPWAIDAAYFSPVPRPLYLTSMAVHPDLQRLGLGTALIREAEAAARAWPADAIRLDAFDAEAGAGAFYQKCGLREVGRVTYRKTPLIYFEALL